MLVPVGYIPGGGGKPEGRGAIPGGGGGGIIPGGGGGGGMNIRPVGGPIPGGAIPGGGPIPGGGGGGRLPLVPVGGNLFDMLLLFVAF